VTDLKAANQMLAQAIAALESPEHDADVNEAEAIRQRLLDLDAAIGERIQAKLDAHRMIVESWGKVEPASVKAMAETNDWMGKPDEPIVSIEDPLAACDAEVERVLQRVRDAHIAAKHHVPTADAWEAHREEHASEYSLTGDEVPDPVLESGVAEMPHSELESA
jgi:hypothetical protein